MKCFEINSSSLVKYALHWPHEKIMLPPRCSRKTLPIETVNDFLSTNKMETAIFIQIRSNTDSRLTNYKSSTIQKCCKQCINEENTNSYTRAQTYKKKVFKKERKKKTWNLLINLACFIKLQNINKAKTLAQNKVKETYQNPKTIICKFKSLFSSRLSFFLFFPFYFFFPSSSL